MFKSKHPRLILNEIKWRFDLNRCRVYYIHRGAPGDVKMIDGSSIKNIERGFMVVEGVIEDVFIPYHRIIMIEYDAQVIFQRKKKYDT